MLEHPKSFHSFVETEHLGGAGKAHCSIYIECDNLGFDDTHCVLFVSWEGRYVDILGQSDALAAAVNLRTRQNLTLIAKDLHTTDNPDTFETKERRHPLNVLILSVGETMEANDHKLDHPEPTLPPSLQLDDELKEEPTH
ncbi:hypothetical protein BLNAU_20174 [Blattamonas nauphoetae]|uniref:Uncharacterized protein n=1 Tax=Blattamonas nauphoetae TaxID=2049346 RepID=A0ABQ9WZC8_9EUKA|nr:hypothetical protein BLNAU_20174 [Blattamonas nauphoetae]